MERTFKSNHKTSIRGSPCLQVAANDHVLIYSLHLAVAVDLDD